MREVYHLGGGLIRELQPSRLYRQRENEGRMKETGKGCKKGRRKKTRKGRKKRKMGE
jgi:hypothetical protein